MVICFCCSYTTNMSSNKFEYSSKSHIVFDDLPSCSFQKMAPNKVYWRPLIQSLWQTDINVPIARIAAYHTSVIAIHVIVLLFLILVQYINSLLILSVLVDMLLYISREIVSPQERFELSFCNVLT